MENCLIAERLNDSMLGGDHWTIVEIWIRDGGELASLISKRIRTMERVKRIRMAMILKKIERLTSC
jgi:hypothetical protein